MQLGALVENVSWASVEVDAAMDRRGRDVAIVVAKVTYKVSLQGAARLVLAPVRRGEVGDEGGGIRFPSDLAADEKPGTDVGLVGVAHPPPRASGRTSAFAWVAMGPLRKVITVYGPRTYTKGWRGVTPSEPAPLVEPVPLRFDQAYGGSDPTTSTTEPYNPLGVGYSSDPARLLGQPTHRLEPVQQESTAQAPHPSHGVFAPIPAHWEPRRALIGTHDAAWAKSRAPVRPRDFDPRHHAWSVPGLYSATPLVGDELIEVGGVLPEGLWKFRLPRYAVTFGSVIEGREATHETHLDSVLIDADTRAVELCWRASIVMPKKWERIDRIAVLGAGKLSEEIRGPRPPEEQARVNAGGAAPSLPARST